MEKMTLREAFQSLEDIKDECWEYSSSSKKLNENKSKKTLKESMSWGDCADVEQAWDAYKKEIGYTYTGDSSDAFTFIDKYVKEHPELDNDEDRDSIFTQISMIEEPSDIEEGCKKESKLKEMYEPISSFKDFTFIDKTNQGWEVKKVYRDLDDDRMHVVVYRPKRNDYAVGLGYSTESGTWNQGWYDYKNIEDAISDLKNEYNVEDYVAKKESCNDESSKKFFKRDKKEEVCKECDTNKKSLKERINDTYQSGNVVATTETRHTPMKNYGYVNLTVNGNTYRGKQSWINRTWEVFFLQTALLDAIRKSSLVTDEQIDELRKYNNFQATLDTFAEMINKKDECITESKQLTEAEKIDISNEEDIEKGKELIKDNKEKEVEDNVEQIVDVDAETIDQLKDSYVGNAILQCGVCRTLIYKKPDLLVRDEENDKLWNVGEQCPHCGSEDGYELVGQVATMDTDVDNTEEQTTGKEEVTTEDETQVDNSIEPQTTEENEYEDEEITFESLNIDRFNKSVNRYLTSLYENVDSFTTTNAEVNDEEGKLIIEGTIKYKNNKTKDTKFIFESKEITKNDKCIFEGYNETFSPKKNAFTLKTSVKDNTLVVESLKYAYSVKTLNESKLIRGKVSSK